jgi:protein TonB
MKSRQKDHKEMYGVYLRVSILSSLLICIALFSFVPYSEPTPYELKKEIVTMVEEINAEIDKYKEPPPEERPRVAIEAPDEIAEQDAEQTIGSTELVENIIRTIPTGPEIEIVAYYKLEKKPKLTNNPVPKYPEIVRRAGIEGKVFVKMLVDTSGLVMETQILKSSGNQMLDQAAVAAAMKSRFSPAWQRDQKVRVWVARKFEFKLQ